MTLTGMKATKLKCYWVLGGKNGATLTDWTGDVYEDIYGLWLKTPTGLIRVKSEECTA